MKSLKEEPRMTEGSTEYIHKLHKEWEKQASERKLIVESSKSLKSPLLKEAKNMSTFYDSNSRLPAIPNHTPVFKPVHRKLLKYMKEHGMMNVNDIQDQLHRFDKVCLLVENSFVGARNSSAIVRQADRVLTKHNINCANTLFAQSVCPDEINHLKGDITNLLIDYFGDVFHLGGLAGIPFTGQTGFSAFSHHVPDNGKLFILIAPHIGVNDALEFGHYSRRGQTCDGAACGAAVGAYKHCLAGKPVPDALTLGSTPFDYQECYIISEVSKVIDKIKALSNENARQVMLVQEMFNCAMGFLNDILEKNQDFGKLFTEVVILGGIQINMPLPLTDYFQPLIFEIRSRKPSLAPDNTMELQKSVTNLLSPHPPTSAPPSTTTLDNSPHRLSMTKLYKPDEVSTSEPITATTTTESVDNGIQKQPTLTPKSPTTIPPISLPEHITHRLSMTTKSSNTTTMPSISSPSPDSVSHRHSATTLLSPHTPPKTTTTAANISPSLLINSVENLMYIFEENYEDYDWTARGP